MSTYSHESEMQARINLEKAIAELKRKHSFFGRNDFCEMYFPGVRSPDSKINTFLREIKDILRDIEAEEKSCDRYLNLHCRDFVEALEKSPTKKWDDYGLPQGDEAQKTNPAVPANDTGPSKLEKQRNSSRFQSRIGKTDQQFPEVRLRPPLGH